MDRSTKQKINKETKTLRDTMDHEKNVSPKTPIERFTLKQSTSRFSQAHTEPSPE